MLLPHIICCAVWVLLALGLATGAGDICNDPELSAPQGGSHLEMIVKYANSCHYDRFKRPNNNSNNDPTVVTTHVHVYFLGPIQAQSLQFVAHLLVRFKWLDDRLAYNNSDVERLTSERQLKDVIWLPKIYLVNEQESIVLGAPTQDVILSVEPNGTVTLVTRVKVTLFCKMALAKFPFDQQSCPMVFETWTYNTSQLVLEWDWRAGDAVTVNENLHLTEYRLVNMNPNSTISSEGLGSTDGSITGTHGSYFGKFEGNYSTLTVEFHLAREVGHYIMDYYVPSILLVVVSWVSFWLDPNAVPGRTTLGTSTMLTFITLTRNIGSSLPKVSYIKATEIWFIVCTAFIFGSLVEFAFVNTIWRRKQNVELKKVNSKYIFKSTLTPQMNRKQIHSNMDRCQSWPSIIDTDGDSPKDLKNYYLTNAPENPDLNPRPPCLRKAAPARKGLSAKNNLTVSSVDSIQTDPYPSEATLQSHLSSPDAASDIVIQVPAPGTTQTQSFTTMTPQEIAQWIDERSRIVFPASFVLFNVLYWGFVWI